MGIRGLNTQCNTILFFIFNNVMNIPHSSVNLCNVVDSLLKLSCSVNRNFSTWCGLIESTQSGNMEIKRFFKPYYHLFYIFGQSPHLGDIVSRKHVETSVIPSGCRKLLFHLPLLVFTVLVLATSFIGIWGHVVSFRSIRSTHQIMKYLFFPNETICNLIIISQCLFGRVTLAKIVYGFLAVDQILRCELKFPVRYNELKWRTFQSVFPVITSFTVSVNVFLLSWYFKFSSWEYSPSLYFLQFPIIMSCAHNIIYVELLRFYLRALNSSIMGETVSTLNVNHMLVYHFYEKRKIIFLKNRLKLFKRIHLALWMITEHINSFFGWSITMNLLSNIFDFVYDIHWLYLCHQGTCTSALDVLGSYYYSIYYITSISYIYHISIIYLHLYSICIYTTQAHTHMRELLTTTDKNKTFFHNFMFVL